MYFMDCMDGSLYWESTFHIEKGKLEHLDKGAVHLKYYCLRSHLTQMLVVYFPII